jgi:hypothetical protein
MGWYENIQGFAFPGSNVVNGILNTYNAYQAKVQREKEHKDLLKEREKERELSKSFQAEQLRQSAAHFKESNKLAKEMHDERMKVDRESIDSNRKTALDVAEINRAATLALPEQQAKYGTWPLFAVPSDILTSHIGDGMLRVVTVLDGFDGVDLSPSTTQFLQRCYSMSSYRPVEILDQAWKPGIPTGGATIKALHSTLKSEPFLVLIAKL